MRVARPPAQSKRKSSTGDRHRAFLGAARARQPRVAQVGRTTVDDGADEAAAAPPPPPLLAGGVNGSGSGVGATMAPAAGATMKPASNCTGAPEHASRVSHGRRGGPEPRERVDRAKRSGG